jgi:hypothetical protein
MGMALKFIKDSKHKDFLWMFFVCGMSILNAQVDTIYTISSLPVNIGGITNYSSCASPGTTVSTFNVPATSDGKILSGIYFTFDLGGASCSSSFNLGVDGSGNPRIAAYLKDNLGNCYNVFRSNLSANSTIPISFKMVSNNHASCLNGPNTANLPTGQNSDPYSSGSFSVFRATINFPSHTNVEGTWTLHFFRNTTSPPCLTNVALEFGGILFADDRTADGNDCTEPIIFDGNPICASTNGKTGNIAEPGSITGSGGTSYTASIGGVSCEWNGRNDNNVWIRFSPDSGPACIGISGLNNSLQSIVVSAVDNDVPCPSVGASGANDTRWNLESCPRNAIYGSTAGSQRNQYHCFDAVAGRIYYLVVDGNGGAESPFYVTGTNINSVLLPVELLYFSGRNENNLNLLEWSTATEINNDYFEVLKSTDGRFFEKIGEVKGHGNSTDKKTYSFKDYEVQDKTNYYRLRQVDFDGKSEFSKIVSVSSKSINSIWTIYPNPAKHILRINSDFSAIKEYTIFNTLGMRVQRGAMNSSEKSIDISSLSLGIYFLKIDNQVERFVVEK